MPAATVSRCEHCQAPISEDRQVVHDGCCGNRCRRERDEQDAGPLTCCDCQEEGPASAVMAEAAGWELVRGWGRAAPAGWVCPACLETRLEHELEEAA